VQDVGICRLIRQLSPDFPIHVSTQMTVTSAAGMEFARELGCNLVVLARECSLKEIEKILAGPSTEPSTGITPKRTALPLEVFVHGALCVAYSGQCLTSEALGGRSANRGECAQACRMPYDLISDGKLVPLGDRKYLLSPQDLAGVEVLPDLVRLGVTSLKIEGRLKAPEYVASITRIYRKALDELAADGHAKPALPPASKYEMEMAFSRGLHTGWFRGINNQQLVHATFGKKRGVYIGEVLEVQSESVRVRLGEQPLQPGDGVVFDDGKPEEPEEGGRVYAIKVIPSKSGGVNRQSALSNSRTGTIALLEFGAGDIDFKRVHPGVKVWKTSDPKLEREVRRTFDGDQPRFERPIFLEVHGQLGGPLSLIVRDESGHIARVESAIHLEEATKSPLTRERLEQQLGRLGGTGFRLGRLEMHIPVDAILPVSELNRLRREAIQSLSTELARGTRWTLQSNSAVIPGTQNGSSEPIRPVSPGCAQLLVLVRNLAQLEAAMSQGVGQIYCDFEDPKKYREAVATFRRERPASPEGFIFVAPPRIFKPGEEWTLKQVRSSEADGYLMRNYDHLQFFADERKVGDHSLNVANHLTADYFLSKFRLERVTASYDLNVHQLESLLAAARPDSFEITLHQHMPMFHMEHCVFCAFLSTGTDYTNCGRPCDSHKVELRDRVGAAHPLKADAGCRNTVFNARAQTGAEYTARFLELGVRHFRIEFLNETAETVRSTIESYRKLLRGELGGVELWRELKLLNQLGVTRGQMAGAATR
jgi:putative protease